MASAPDPILQRLRAAITDGRTANIRYRQNEFQKLHTILAENAETLATAIAKDTQATKSEIEVELFLTMDSIKHFYDSLNLGKELKEEYSITNGEDNPNRRVGVGLVVIRPTAHTRLYSVLSPICAAIAAGNCILLELEPGTLNIDTLLQELLPKALDQDTFSISTKSLSPSTLELYLLVDQTYPSTFLISKTNELLSSTKSRTIAIVDRTADVEAAGKAIVAARFSFQGASPYAPDLVVVNDFVKEDFFKAVTRYATQMFAEQKIGKVTARAARSGIEETRKVIKEAGGKGQLTSFGSSDFKILDISDRSCPLTTMKISGYYLPIVSSTSITDAVFSQDPNTSFLAGYFFAAPSAAKFISQHLPCTITYVNQIPPHLLLGPSSPASHQQCIHPRYTTSMFSVPRPQFITPISSPIPIPQILNGASKVEMSKIRRLGMEPLKPTGQGKGHAIGFFEQGIITGAAVLFGVVVPGVVYGSWVVGRKGMEWLRTSH